jgi:hypothetical protein
LLRVGFLENLMAIPAGFLTTTCDIYRPFGAASPTTMVVPCRLSPAPMAGVKPDGLSWSHTLDLQPGTDIRDGTTRTAGTAALSYTEGDEVRVPSGGLTRYVVVWVEVVARDTPQQFLRAYLLRHEASWLDP